ANKEENNPEDVNELIKHYPVWVSDISNVEDATEMIQSIGELTGRKEAAISLIRKIKNSFNELTSILSTDKLFTVCYLIWNNTLMTVGNDTFIHDMLLKCGFQNVFESSRSYLEITVY